MNLTTEQANPASAGIDRLSSLEIVSLINAEDATVATAVQRALPEIARSVDVIAGALASGGRLFYVGAGTSGRLGALDAVECLPTFSVPPGIAQAVLAGGQAAMTQSIEGAEDDPTLGKRDLQRRDLCAKDVVCGIAASGRTPYVIGALEYAKAAGAATIAIACNANSPIADIAETAISVEVGPEVIAGSTRMKAGTAQKMILNMLSSGSMIRLGKVYGNLMVDVKASNAKLEARARNLVTRLTGLDEAAAGKLLAEADYRVKTAVAMARLGVDRAEAERRLGQADGHLRRVID